MGKSKICKKCGEQRPLFGFGKNRNMKEGIINECNVCIAKKMRIFREKNSLRDIVIKVLEYLDKYRNVLKAPESGSLAEVA